MKHTRLLAVISLCLIVVCATAHEPTADSPSCPIPPLPAPIRYGRLHQIPTTPERDDATHKVVTPGGMVFDTPKMVAATDVLLIAARDPTALCFSLLTFAKERHSCQLSGVARNQWGNTFLFGDGDIVVRFTLLGEDEIRIEPIGNGYRARCESLGKIEPAVYTLSSGPD